MKFILSLFVIACFGFTACQKEELQIPNTELSSDMSLGRLSFDAQADFDQAIGQLKKRGIS